jgi:hypothetical protein
MLPDPDGQMMCHRSGWTGDPITLYGLSDHLLRRPKPVPHRAREMQLTPTLLTFCYIKDTFDRSGDLMLGLAPLFVPIASKFRGKQFEPAEFVREVQNFYGISMPEAVAEELAIRLNKSGYLRAQDIEPYVQKLFYNDNYDSVLASVPEIPDVEVQIEALITHVRREFVRLFPGKPDDGIEVHILTALANLNFSKEFSAAQTDSATAKKPAGEKESKESDAIGIIVADYILEAKNNDPTRFNALLLISGGALLTQVVATIKNPPTRGVLARQLTVYFDTPMVLQYFGFEGFEKQQAISAIISSLKIVKAQWGVYRQNVQEMHALLKRVTESIHFHGHADFEVGRCVTASASLRTRAREIIQNPDGTIKRVGFKILETSYFSDKVRSVVPPRFELGLTEKIRPMGKMDSREVDASAVCNTVRQRQENRPSDYLKAHAIFVSPNASLVSVAQDELGASGLLLTGEISYVLTTAQLAGILWIAAGAGGAELPAKTLLANCVAALASNQPVIDRMREILSSLGEQEARDFEGIIANDRCAYYLTKLTAGRPVLLTKETGLEVFEELRRRVAVDVEKDAAQKYTQTLQEKEQEHALKFDEISAELAQQKDQAEQALEAEKIARADMARKLEELEKSVTAIAGQRESAHTALILLCRQHRRRVEFIWSLGFAVATGLVGFLAGQLGTLAMLPLWASAGIGTGIGILCGAAGFHIVPNYMFGGFIEKEGARAFISKGKELDILVLAQEILDKERSDSRRKSK